jgi:putative peptide zinc metalloprotease protein
VVETTVWPSGAPLPTPGHPQLAMVLVPREPGQPGWVFPFNRPAPPGPGDNQAMAVATRDGSAVYDVAFALVTATTDTVLNGNEAYAFASCSRCAAVAVSFQVVLVVGDAHVIAPKNISAAVAYNCMSCVTAAIAIQLDVQLPTSPGASTAARLAALWTQIRAFGRHVSSFSLAEIRSRIHRYERQILQILQPLAATSSAGVAAPSPASASSGSTVPGSPALGTSTAGAGRPDPSGSGQGADPPTSAAPSPSETTAPPTSASESGSSPSAPPSDPAASTSP